MRQMIPLALIGLALLPDWANAFGKRCYPPCPPPTPTYLTCPPQVVILSPCLPSFEVLPYNSPPIHSTPLAAPTVTPETAKPEAAKPEAPLPAPPKAPMPGVPPNRSSLDSGNTETGLNQVEFVIPNVASPTAATPQAETVTQPRSTPTIVVESVAPKTVEAKREAETLRIPPLIPRVPGGDSSLPPLLVPTPVNDQPGTSTSRSSPLSNSRQTRYEVIPVDGVAPSSPSAKRSIGFFNHTQRDLQLTVEGQTITLPKRHSVTAEVPAKFTWKVDANLEQTTEIPLADPGVEVVIRR